MNRKRYAQAKQRLEEIQRVLDGQLLTPEQQRELEQDAAALTRVLQRRIVMGHVWAALIGAVIGAALAIANQVMLAPETSNAPVMAGGCVSYYAWLCLPWALLGAVAGALLGRLGYTL